MNTSIRGLFCTLLLTFSALSVKAELIVALTPAPEQWLLTFTSERPGAILSAVPIVGLLANEQVLGIDTRPADGDLYALTNLGRLYLLNATDGMATFRAALGPAPGDPFTMLMGTRFGLDFNPVADRLRVVSDADQNLRIHPDTGAVTTDTPLSYAAGDPSQGRNPQIVGAAYTNNDTDPATPTTLFALEQELYNSKVIGGALTPALSLVRQGGPDGVPSPNGGVLNTVGAFGRDGVTIRGFDVGPSAKAFIGVELENLADPSVNPFFALVKVLLAPDPMDPVGQPAGKDESLGYVGDGRVAIADIAVVPSVQFDMPLRGVREGTPTVTLVVSRHGGSANVATVNFATQNGTATAGQDYLSNNGILTFNPGEVLKMVTVDLQDDNVAEGDESFQIALANPQGVTLGGASFAQVRISANDFTDREGPVVTHFGLTGPSRGITGAVVGFSEDLDAATATHLANYTLVGDSGGRKTPVTFESATYDENTRTVTLRATPFRQTELRGFEFTVRGKKPKGNEPAATGIRDVAGNLLDGRDKGKNGEDADLDFDVLHGETITITDEDGDRATIGITGGGSIDASVLKGKSRRTQFWILDPIALRSTLSGSVASKPRSDGIVVIAEIIGLDKKEFAPLLTNPSFRVNTLTFSSNATGR